MFHSKKCRNSQNAKLQANAAYALLVLLLKFKPKTMDASTMLIKKEKKGKKENGFMYVTILFNFTSNRFRNYT